MEKTIAEKCFDDYMVIKTCSNHYGTFRDQKQLSDWLKDMEECYGKCRFFPFGGGYDDPTIGFSFPDGSYMEIDNSRQRQFPVFANWVAKRKAV